MPRQPGSRLRLSSHRLPSWAGPGPSPGKLYLLLAAWLAVPSLAHLPALLSGRYYFYQSYLAGAAPQSPLVRLADFTWLLLGLAGLLLVQRYRPVRLSGAGLAAAWALFAAIVPLGSADFLFYFHMGRDWLASGVNPYAQGFEIPNPFLFEGAGSLLSPNVPYPPLWVLTCAGLRLLAGERLWLFALLLKLLLGAAHVGNFRLLLRLERRFVPGTPADSADPAGTSPGVPPPAAAGGAGALPSAAWWYLLCPVFLWETLTLMHFEILWLFFGLLAVERLSRGRPWQAAATWAIAFWVKYTAVFVLPVFLPALLDRRRPLRHRLGLAGGVFGLWLLVGTAATMPFDGWGGLWRGLQLQFGWLYNSWPVLLLQLCPALSGRLPLVKLGLLAAAALSLLLAPRRPRLDNLPGALAWTVAGQLAFLLLARPLFFPWYALWPLLFALPLLGTRWAGLFQAAWALAALSALYYPLQYTVGHIQASFDQAFQSGYLLLSHLFPLLLLGRCLYGRFPDSEQAPDG